MHAKLFEFLFQLREELKKENILLYFRLQPNGRLYVGVEYKYVGLDFHHKPRVFSGKECSCNVDLDNLTEEKYEKFVKNFDKFLTKVRGVIGKDKEAVKSFVIEIEGYL